MSRTRLVIPGRTSALSTLLAITASLSAQTAQQAALQISAIATVSPPSLTFSWPTDSTASGFTVARRLAGTATWDAPITIAGGGAATSWTDTTAAAGTRYEYWFAKSGGISARGLVTAAIEGAAIEDRGAIVLLVDDTMATALGVRIDRLVKDLIGDGWWVVRYDVPRTAAPAWIRALISATDPPSPIKAVFSLGHVPVPYSGNFAPDHHGDHYGAWPADAYYGDLDGTWTDTSANNVSAARPQNRNVPGDGKFDQSLLPSDVELAVGRVDFADMPSFALGEMQLLEQYLDKDHGWRHGDFTVASRAVIDDNFGFFNGEAFAASGWRNFSALVGAANIVEGDYFKALTSTRAGYLWSYGCGGGWYTSCDGVGSTSDFAASQTRGVFTMLFGSYFGDWDSTDNLLRAPLCQGLTLASAWAGRPHWSFHPMGMGETIGNAARLSQNDTTAGGLYARFAHIALMGDPTLRQHVIAPAADVLVSAGDPHSLVTWSPSRDSVAGYHVYRAPSAYGPFVRVTTVPVTGTWWVDAAPPVGAATYMVRALRLETTPTGTYWNLSQGAFSGQ